MSTPPPPPRKSPPTAPLSHSRVISLQCGYLHGISVQTPTARILPEVVASCSRAIRRGQPVSESLWAGEMEDSEWNQGETAAAPY